MRFFTLIFVLLLGACTTPNAPDTREATPSDLRAAQRYCQARKLNPGSYAYDVCYKTQPVVQTYERNGRMRNMGILAANRSPRSYIGRSYPVE